MRQSSPLSDQPESTSTIDLSLGSANTERPNSYLSNGTNANAVQADLLEPAVNNVQFHEKQPTRDNNEDDSETDSSEKSNSSLGSSPADSIGKLETQKNPKGENESLDKCKNEARRQNETYTRSIPLNMSSVDPGEDFKIAGEAEAKKVSSVNVGEDIALCWIETITIKEDPAFDPPKRLVIREFTISFENSATIPDNYLECDRVEGEIEPGDEETVGKSSLNEVIDENTKRSREVNFTSVSHVGPLVVRQHRKIKCSVGAVVSKDIYVWPDGTDNPKKRVEIKVGPSIRDLGVRTPEDARDCATDDPPERPKADEGATSSSDCTSSVSCEISVSCEDGPDCNRSRTVSACEENDCSSARGSPGESIPTTYPPDSNDLLPAGVATSTVGKKSDEDPTLKKSPKSNKLDRYSDEVCDENSTDCVRGTTTGPPETDIEATTGGKNADGTSTEDTGESCQEGSEDCSCSESFCSIDRSDKSRSLEFGNKRAELATISSLTKGPNEAFTESTTKTIMPLNETECDSGSGECSESSSEEVAGTKAGTEPGRNVSENGQFTDDKKVTNGLTDTDDGTAPRQVGDSELAEMIGATTVPGNTHFSHEEPRDGDASSSYIESTEPSIPKRENSASSTPRFNDNERSCDETSDDEDCTSMDSNNDDSATESDSTVTLSSTEKLTESPNSPTSEESEGVMSRESDRYTSMPSSHQTDERTPTIESTARLPKEQPTDCSANSESGDCSAVAVSPILVQNKTIEPSNQDDTSFSTEPCESSGSCGSTETDLGSAETSQAPINPAANAKTPEESSCDESSEACDSSSSSTDSESCEDGSSSSHCTSEGDSLASVSCDVSSGSCSSESSEPASVAVETTTSTTEAMLKELENSSTTIDNLSTTLETRRSTVPTLFLTSQPSNRPHRLALRIKVLLERINENKEKEKLVHVEKNLLINENPNDHGNQSLVWKVKSLNDTINLETLRAIFNCSDFAKLSESLSNVTELGLSNEERSSVSEKTMNIPPKKSTKNTMKENEDYSGNESTESSPRKKRQTSIDEKHMAKNTNITEATKAKAIQESIPGVEEDLKKGMDHVLSRISKELDSSASKATESSSSNLLKILASPIEGRVRSRRRRGVKKVGAVMVVEQLKNPVKGEEIDRWSNERIISAPDGGNVRSVMEFKLLRDAVEATP